MSASGYPFQQHHLYQSLMDAADRMRQPEYHLGNLMQSDQRWPKFSRQGAGLLFDFTRQRIDEPILELLLQVAADLEILPRFRATAKGQIMNVTEKRPALHTAARDFSSRRLMVNDTDVVKQLEQVRHQFNRFSADVRSGRITGSTGKAFQDVVVIGIGGSHLGTEFVATALSPFSDGKIRLHFLSNVDIHNFGLIASRIDPETTLWIVISKSYTTAETLANASQAMAWMKSKGVDPAGHLVTVTAQGSPGDSQETPVLATFHMFDFIGGRYSVTSAVGGVPLSIYLGCDLFEEFLKGAGEMDRHAAGAAEENNLPLLAALISVWNTSFLGYQHQAIIPYAAPLSRLPAHIQQLNMESNGKSASADGKLLAEPAGVVIFGEPGTNAQHSFFQLAHQGRPFPIDFIGIRRPFYNQYQNHYQGVTNHQELWANLLAQATALATGHPAPDDPARHFPGNRPSSLIVLESLEPYYLGSLLAFYEARTIMEGYLWGINPFDQFGVQLGKKVAGRIRQTMARKNSDPDRPLQYADPLVRAHLERLLGR